jgi:hypothetical protein
LGTSYFLDWNRCPWATIGDGFTSVNLLQFIYDTSTSKLGVRWNTGGAPGTPGTATFQSGTTATNTWVLVDISMFGAKTVNKNMRWALDGVEQTALSTLVTSIGTYVAGVYIGQWAGFPTQTVTADFDDWRVSTNKRDFPLGNQKVVLLKVDPAGTVVLSGTATNFQTFAGATPTLTAWNATTARNATDEVPPGLGASADGVAQVAAATADYVEFPMETYTLAANEVILSVRAIMSGWAAGASNLGLRGWDGTTETVLFTAADPGFNNSATAPGWVSKRWVITPRWTQAKLNAATLRVGFGNNAVDVGVHAVYLEVVIGTVTQTTLTGDLAAQSLDASGNNAMVSATVSAPVGYPTDLYYEVNGTPTTVNVPEGTTVTQVMDAPDATAINYVAVYPGPEPSNGT